MVAMRSLGRQFGWLWAAFAVSTFGTCLAFEAYPLIAIIVLHAGPTEVSVLAAGEEPSARRRRSRSGLGWNSTASGE